MEWIMEKEHALLNELIKSFKTNERVWGIFINGVRVRMESGSIAWKEKQHARLALYEHIAQQIYSWYDRKTGKHYSRIGDVTIEEGIRSGVELGKALLESGVAEIKLLG